MTLQNTPTLGYNRVVMQLKAGSRWRSAVCATEVMVIAAPDGDVALTCGGAPVEEPGAEASGATLSPDFADGSQVGKRYVDATGELELLCTRPGDGSLAVSGQPLTIKGAKPLPSSD